jgi:hypothetical protein
MVSQKVKVVTRAAQQMVSFSGYEDARFGVVLIVRATLGRVAS